MAPAHITPTTQELLTELAALRQDVARLRATHARRHVGVPAPRRILVTLCLLLALLGSGGGSASAAGMHALPFPWLIGGNGHTNPATNFLGTTDAQPLVVRTNNAEALRVTVDGSVGIGTSSPVAKLTVNGSISATGGSFSNPISGSVTGNAGTVTNGVYTTGSYADPAWLTALAGSKISGPVAGATHATTADSATMATGFTGSLGGDVTGSQGSTTVTALRGVGLSGTAPSAGQVLTYNGSTWVPDSAVTTLQGQVATLQNQVSQLQGLLAAFSLSADGTTLTISGKGANAVAAAQRAQSAPAAVCTTCPPVAGSPLTTVQFNGVNVQVVNGTGQETQLNGLGNLIVGYADNNLSNYDRSGSHNLITGDNGGWSSYGGLLAGEANRITAPFATVSGGDYNTAAGQWAVISGGRSNTAGAPVAAVSGGYSNTASGQGATVSGGYYNTASGGGATVSGGESNTASGDNATVSGGLNNTAAVFASAILGGWGTNVSVDCGYFPDSPTTAHCQ